MAEGSPASIVQLGGVWKDVYFRCQEAERQKIQAEEQLREANAAIADLKNQLVLIQVVYGFLFCHIFTAQFLSSTCFK